jgi:ABC-2 type transport system permease protein
MITTIARKEMLEMLRDGRFRWAAAIVFTLLLSSVALGWHHYREVNAQHETARQATRRQWLHQGEKNPHSAAHYGVYAFKPKMPLSLVDRGVDPFVGVATWLEAHHQNDFQYRPAQDSTALHRFGELTGATVLQLLVPLLIVLLTFSAFSGEREQGTLRQLLSLGVKRSDLALGKAAGIAAALGLLLAPAAVLGVIGIALSSENGSFFASMPRMGLMTASYLLYFASFLGVSLAVSARTRSSRVALVVLLGFWIFNGLVAPRAVSDLAKALHPTPSAFEFQQRIEMAIQNGLDGNEPAEKRTAALRERLLAQYRVSRVEDLPVNFRGLALQEGEEYGNRVFDRYFTELWETFRRQEQVHYTAAVAAPVLAVRALSMGFAGTDFSQHLHFARAAEDHRRLIQREMNLDLAYNAKGGGEYLRGADLWEKVPDFHYHAPAVSWVLSRQTFNFVLLAAWCLAAGACAWAAVRSLRVE